MSTGGALPNTKKYNVVSKGIWAWIRNKIAIAPNRSTGIPIAQEYRKPAPGSQPTNSLPHDVGSLPAIDIAENRYYNRDTRRAYPQVSVFTQSSLAGLLLYGSKAQPKLAKGDEGTKQLATVANGELNLTDILASKEVASQVLESSGLPPLPAQLHSKHYVIQTDAAEHGMYSTEYPVRMFK